jgi:hypothetical protein
VAEGVGNDIFVVLVVVALLRDLAECTRQIGGNGGLFGDDEGLHEAPGAVTAEGTKRKK